MNQTDKSLTQAARRASLVRNPGTDIAFERVAPAYGTSTAKTEYHTVVPFVGGVVVRQEATTHAYPRGAANPRWFVYVDGRRTSSYGRKTLAEAKQDVRNMS
jgi:hypothetical protein